MSCSPPRAETTMIPTAERSRICRQSSKPSTSGSIRSSRTMSGRLGLEQLEGARSVGRDASVEAAHGQVAPDQVDDVGVVLVPVAPSCACQTKS